MKFTENKSFAFHEFLTDKHLEFWYFKTQKETFSEIERESKTNDTFFKIKNSGFWISLI